MGGMAGIFGYVRAICAGLLWLFLVSYAAAQINQSDAISAPDFTVENLENRIEKTAADKDLTPENIELITERLQAAILALNSAVDQKEKADEISREFESTQQVIDGLRSRMEKLQEAPPPTVETDIEDAPTKADLQRLERERLLVEGDLRNYETELVGYRSEIQAQTELSIQEELVRAQEDLEQQTNRLETLRTEKLDSIEDSLRILTEAQAYESRNTVTALEREIAFQPTRLQILELRRDLAQAKVDSTARRVISLQNQTGMRRFHIADNVFEDVQTGHSGLENAHPFVLDYASENLSIADLLRESAREASLYPRIQAETREQLLEIDNDLEVADRLTSIGEFNRQSSATLRQLRDQRPSVKSVQAQINSNEKRELNATQQQLWARQELRQLPFGQADLSEMVTKWLAENNGRDALTSSDYELLESLNQQRRNLLNQYSDYVSHQYRESKKLSSTQDRLLENSQKLNEILDQNLLWLPSARAIDGEWPARAWRGGKSVFSSKNLTNIFAAFNKELQKLWFPLMMAILLALLMLTIRPRLQKYIYKTSAQVGRVQLDSYWHSPGVLVSTALMTAPIPLLLLTMGIIFKNSTTPDAFVDSLGQTGIELSGFFWFFMMWKEWNKDKSLYDTHYSAPRFFRHNTLTNLRWFIPAAGITIAFVTLTQNSRIPDVYEGFSVLAFIVTAFILTIFGFRLLKMDKKVLHSSFSENNLIRRYYRPIMTAVAGLPIAAAILAAIGYYDTAVVLLSRLFLTAGLTLATYTLYGLLRRSLLVAQRRLSLRQAQERYEQLKLARKEKAEAEQRGDASPAQPINQVNYDEIDVETLNRQSVQLINTFIALGFAITMWIVWRDLFPALSVFDEVKLWPKEDVTLWNLIQSLAIAVLTFIAAKNIPGLLDAFVLNRSRMDRGTRYATTSVFGYIIFAIGFFWAFHKLGMDWSQLQWIIAALSVGIGFGLQEIIANFVSGLIILFERPIRVGDYITIGDKSGTVRRIQIRATTLSDLDNREIFIPNRELITQKVTNWTLTDSITRVIIPVGIAYGSDTDKARDIMQDVLQKNKRVLRKPKSNVYFLGFGESSLDFELRIFVRSVDDRFEVSHELHTEINRALKDAGFEIPFPQRDLNIRSQPET